MNQHWHWQTWQDYAYLTCDLLSPWQHGFFTQEFYPRTPEDLTSIWQLSDPHGHASKGKSFRASRSPITAYRVKQIHGNLVLTPQEITDTVNQLNSPHELAEADAVISDYAPLKDLLSPSDLLRNRVAHTLTDRSQESVWAASADCTPVLIGDIATGQVCAIHAGWRGTAQKIVPQAISRFLEFGSKKSSLRVAIGPAISGKMYQVDEKVAIEVARSILPQPNLESETVLNKLKQFPHAPILEDELPGKVRLDVPRINHLQLEQLGIDPVQIAIAPYCTFQEKDLFFSYRRTGEKKVQWSGIVSR
ncbi:MAG: peptidoglycan editing factor PgeF [Pleurocapsa sp. SU_5_0]|nr:peptidoglycan editing factor PgeF [Pleurocapsa sp. SU_5_0]NJR45369.1 peptidoglycan editing factor PgeF [Hyellaceae cyanobacterium CSU_1_1]